MLTLMSEHLNKVGDVCAFSCSPSLERMPARREEGGCQKTVEGASLKHETVSL